MSAAVTVGGGNAAAHAVTFGGIETMNPAEWIADEAEGPGAQVAADSVGGAIHISTIVEVRDQEEGIYDRQAAIYERCGSPDTWTRTAVLGALDEHARSTGVAVAPNGAAIAVWIDGALGASGTIRSSYRPPGGTWASEQVVATEEVGSVDVAIADNGDATLLWQRSATSSQSLRSATRSASSGSWSSPVSLGTVYGDQELAVDGDGTALVVHQSSPTRLEAFVKPAGQPWSASETVTTFDFSTQIRDLEVEFDPTGAAVAAYHEWNSWERSLRATRRGAAWSPPHTLATFDSLGGIGGLTLARHPQGLVLGWIQDEYVHGDDSDVGVARHSTSGTWEEPKVYDPAGGNYASPTVAADDDGNAILALNFVAYGGAIVVHGAQVPDLVTPWPASLSPLSPEASAEDPDRREPYAAGGDRLVVAWEVHDGTGDRRSEAIASGGAAPGCPGTGPGGGGILPPLPIPLPVPLPVDLP